MGVCRCGEQLTTPIPASEPWWKCEGALPGAMCARNLSRKGEHPGVERLVCEGCRISYCDKCVIVSNVRAVTQGGTLGCLARLLQETLPEALSIRPQCNGMHDLVLNDCMPGEDDWLCDGSADPGGCIGVQQPRDRRWRCFECNFDLCESCAMRRRQLWASPTARKALEQPHAPNDVDEDEAQILSQLECEGSESEHDAAPLTPPPRCRGSSIVVYEPHQKVSSAVTLFGGSNVNQAFTPTSCREQAKTVLLPTAGSPRSQILTASIGSVAGLRDRFL
ncbi:hypothetical protein DIPPA_25714 [Diplonema papillatum]|nr:hypothetical protein DIPPA_25714 [Diplonema papillatum]